jgi:hypothetical protein
MAVFLCDIDGVDVSARLKGVELDPGGDGINGTGRLYFDQQAGGMNVRNMSLVRVWQAFDDTGVGIAQRGRLFAGHVNLRDTGNAGTTKLWRITAWDLNVVLSRVVRDVQGAKSISITAGSFSAQIGQLCDTIQYNGHAAGSGPPTLIDYNLGVTNFYGSMPAVVYPGGHSWAWYIRQLCGTAQLLVPTIRPHFYLGVGTAYGAGAAFGVPVLWIYDGATLPAPAVQFSDTPVGAQKKIFGTWRRTDDSTVLTQRQQSVWNQATVSEGYDTTSQTSYPNPYINHDDGVHPIPARTGFWMEEAIIDTKSTSTGQAQAAITNLIAAKANPKETVEFDTYERVLPGEVVRVTWALEGFSNLDMTVATAKLLILDDGAVQTHLTLNNRRLRLFDTGDEVVMLHPVEVDTVAPLPPGLPVKTGEVYDWATGRVQVTFQIPPSPSPDAYRYEARIINSGAEPVISPVDDITHFTPTFEFLPSASSSIQVRCYDRTNNVSAYGPLYSWTTIGVPALLALPGALTNTINAFDSARDQTRLDWTWTAPADPLALGISGYRVTFTQGNIGASVVLGVVLSYERFALPGIGYTFTVAAIDGHGRVGAVATNTGTAASRVWPELYNPSFENIEDVITPLVPRGWTFNQNSGTVTWDTAQASNGARSVKFVWNGVGTPPQILSDFFRIDPRSSYGLSIDQMGLGTTGSPTYTFNWYDAAFHLLSGSGANFPAITTAWASVVGVDTQLLPAGPVYCRLQIGADIVSGNTIWVDNLRLSLQATTPLIANSAITSAKMADTGVLAATYKIPRTTINTKGQITAAIEQAGTAFPGSPATNDFFYRTDLGVICQYDGTRWLGPEIALPLYPWTTLPPWSTANVDVLISRLDAARPIWLTRWNCSFLPNSANTGLAYWNLLLRRQLSGGTFVTMATQTSQSLANGAWSTVASITSFSNNPTAINDNYIDIFTAIVSTPGSFYALNSLYGRMVYT